MAWARVETVREAGRRLWRRGARRVQRAAASRRGAIAYLAVIGPGVVAANAGNDAGDIAGIVTVDDAMEYLLPKDWRQRLPRVFG